MGEIDINKANLLMTAISSVAAFCTMIFVAYTILEMARQRKGAYRPDMILSSSGFYIYWHQRVDEMSFLSFSNEFRNPD